MQYRVQFRDGSSLTVSATSEAAARRVAEKQARMDRQHWQLDCNTEIRVYERETTATHVEPID
jgi:hypothetical protein